MKKLSCCYLIFLSLVFTGCAVSHTYFESPMDVNANNYHVIPMRSDSAKSAVYASGNFLAGTYNYQGRDNIFGFQGNVYRSHSLGIINAFYGAGLTLGNYHVADYYYIRTYHPSADTTFHFSKTAQSFGAYGANGGLNVALPFPNRKGEMRIGFETSLYREFGEYLKYRKAQQDSVVDILATSRFTKTLGLSMEFLWKRRRSGTIVGYKAGIGWSFVTPENYRGDESQNVPFYVSNAVQVTHHHFTGWLQFNIGNHATTFQAGVAYRLLTRNKRTDD